MRLRNIKGSRETIAAKSCVIQNPEEQKGRWNAYFGNHNPLRIEIGMGKGQFLMECARQNPDINYIGIEKYSSVLLRATEKWDEEPLDNIRFLRFDAEYLLDIFDTHEVSRIYLNFSDPWPKDRHAKRRLTSRQFLARYAVILEQEGCVEFKTDNLALFEFSLEEADACGFAKLAVTHDLHNEPALNAHNIMTEYEQRFSALGNPICKVIMQTPASAAF